MSHDHSHSSNTRPHLHLGHIVPFKIYVTVLCTLVVLTGITVYVAVNFHFGAMNLVVAMLIASVKASLVALFFMHLKYENPITWLYVFFPLALLCLMLGGIFIDNPYRINPLEGKKVVAVVSPLPVSHHP